MSLIKKKMLPKIDTSMLDLSNANWASDKEYTPGMVVKSQNNIYVCSVGHTSSLEFDKSKFQILSEGLGYQLKQSTEIIETVPEDVILSTESSTQILKPFILKYDNNSFIEAVSGTDYTLSYTGDLSTLTVTILTTGTYKINY